MIASKDVKEEQLEPDYDVAFLVNYVIHNFFNDILTRFSKFNDKIMLIQAIYDKFLLESY